MTKRLQAELVELREIRDLYMALRDSEDRIQALAASDEVMKEADRRKDEFIALLAHELRNPLAPICTGLEVMRLAVGNPAVVENARSTMERQAAI